MLIAKNFAAPDSPATDTLVLTYEERLKSRQHLLLSSGEEFGYSLPPGTCLRDGNKLMGEENGIRRVVEIVAAAEELVQARVDDVLHIARTAYHLGNRHVKVEIGGDGHGLFLRLQPDHVLEEMLHRLHCRLTRVKAPFHPESGAYDGQSHNHEHAHGADDHHPHETSLQKIHTFR
jgi:urease accessory protein